MISSRILFPPCEQKDSRMGEAFQRFSYLLNRTQVSVLCVQRHLEHSSPLTIDRAEVDNQGSSAIDVSFFSQNQRNLGILLFAGLINEYFVRYVYLV